MIICKYWDSGWCYATDNVETTANSQGACFDYDFCPYLKSQMTKMTSEMFGANIPIVPDETIEEWKEQGLLSENQNLPEMIEVNGVKYQRVKQPQKSKTLWERFYDAKWSDSACDEFCEIVHQWISQCSCDFNDRYAEGYETALKDLKENLK